MEGKTAGEYYKNIKVLKEIPASELIPSMQFITASLGVECDFCHVEREFDKDDKKPKGDRAQDDADAVRHQQEQLRRRTGSHVQQLSSRSDASGSRARCSGSECAAREHGADEHDAEHEMEMNPAKWPSGSAVVAKYIEAVGGKSALDKITRG